MGGGSPGGAPQPGVSSVIAVDTSVWIDWFAGHKTPQVDYLAHCLELGSEDFALVDITLTEVLQGLRHDKDVQRVERSLEDFLVLRLANLADFRAAAAMYRDARKRGITVRSTIDCLIAAACIREEAELLHSDKDFTQLAKVSPLSIVDLG
jgi:predicted nucleic acid-binding protein